MPISTYINKAKQKLNQYSTTAKQTVENVVNQAGQVVSGIAKPTATPTPTQQTKLQTATQSGRPQAPTTASPTVQGPSLSAIQQRVAERQAGATPTPSTSTTPTTSTATSATTATTSTPNAGVTPTSTEAGTQFQPSEFKTERQKTAEFASDLFGEEGLLPSSLEEQINLLKTQQSKEKEMQDLQFKQEREEEQLALERQKKTGASSISQMESTFAQSREEAMSTSNPLVVSEYSQRVRQDIQNAENQVQYSEQRRQYLSEQLAQAQKEGRAQFAVEIQQELAQAEAESYKAKQALAETEREAMKTAMEVADKQARLEMDYERLGMDKEKMLYEQKKEGLNNFTSMIKDGVQLDEKGLISMSKQLGIDFALAYNYYTGAQSIRDDKTLSLAEKEMKLKGMTVDLDRKMRGITNQTLENIDYLKTAYANGASAEEIALLKRAMNIQDQDDPMYMADIQLKQLEAQKRALEVSNYGKPPEYGTKEYYELEKTKLEIDKIKKEQSSLSGEAGGLPITIETKGFSIENMDSRIISGGASNGSGRVDPGNYLEILPTGLKRGNIIKDKSGKPIARVSSYFGANHGKISGETNHNGVDLVFNGGNVKALSGGTVVKTGYAPKTYGGYVWIADSNGRVTQYGHMNVDDINALKIGQTIETGQQFARHETRKNKWGSSSGAHTDVRYVGQGVKTQETVKLKPLKDLTSSDKTQINKFFASGGKEFPYWADSKEKKDAFIKLADKFDSEMKSKDTPIRTLVENSVGKKDLTVGAMDKLQQLSSTKDALEELNSLVASTGTGVISGRLKGLNPNNVTVKEIETRLTQITPALARGVFGEVGVLTDSDMKRYMSTLPNNYTDEDVNKMLGNVLEDRLKKELSSTLRGYAGTYDVSEFAPLLPNELSKEEKEQASREFSEKALDFSKGVADITAQKIGKFYGVNLKNTEELKNFEQIIGYKPEEISSLWNEPSSGTTFESVEIDDALKLYNSL